MFPNTANNRLSRISNHLNNSNDISISLIDNNNEVVIISALRTPIQKAKRGEFKNTSPDILLSTVLDGVINQSGIDKSIIGDIVIGNVLQSGSGAVMARMAQFQANIPYTVPLATVNRQCSSGLQAFAIIASGIISNFYDVGIAGGVESMSTNSMTDVLPDVDWDKVNECDECRECTIPMGVTSDNIAEKFNISRRKQDEFSANSQKKALNANQNGLFRDEIIPVKIIDEDDDGNENEKIIREDGGIRPNTTADKLSKLNTVFSPDGTTTAGNSSQVSDGAAAILCMKRSIAENNGLNILGTFISFAVVGVPPSIMGVGPAYAIPKAVEKAGLTLSDIEVFEINEAFASQCIYCIEYLGINPEKVNPNGGAIALGHPLGCTGARMIATLLHELKRRKTLKNNNQPLYGVVSMCIGTGMGAAAVFRV